MKTMRFLALILALLLCSTLSISCNKKKVPENTQETQNTSETVPPATIAPKTLVEHCNAGFGIANVVRNEKGLRTCELGLDWSRDTYDAGLHLNVYGAEKFTSYLGRLMQSEHGVPDRRGDAALDALWQERIDRYKTEKTEGENNQ